MLTLLFRPFGLQRWNGGAWPRLWPLAEPPRPPPSTPLPLVQAHLTGWTNCSKNTMLTAAGIGGHQLTTLAFNASVATLQQTMTDTNERSLDFK